MGRSAYAASIFLNAPPRPPLRMDRPLRTVGRGFRIHDVVRRLLLTRIERTTDAKIEPDPAIKPDAVNELPPRLDHLRGDVHRVYLEDQVPGPEGLRRLAHLKDVVDERRDGSGAQLLPLGDHLLEAWEEDLDSLLVRGRKQGRRPAAGDHDPVRR